MSQSSHGRSQGHISGASRSGRISRAHVLVQEEETATTTTAPTTMLGSDLIKYEMKNVAICVVVSILLDFLLLSMDLHEGLMSNVMFGFVILGSILFDISKGSVLAPVYDVEKRMLTIALMILLLFVTILACVCFTDQFWSPVVVEFENEPGDEDYRDDLTTWQFVYKGFHAVHSKRKSFGRTVLDNLNMSVSKSDDDEFDNDHVDEENEGHSWMLVNFLHVLYPDINLRMTAFNAAIHALVCATKITLVKFIILQAETTIKLLIGFYSAHYD